ncbi:MAG: V-type ATPase 116kDa subunit family protein [Candidatus Micrarchaeaceae archaeon]
MLHSEQMQKVRIIGLQSDKQAIVKAMHGLGVLDIRKASLQMADDAPSGFINEVSDALIRVGGALQIIERKKKRSEAWKRPARLEAHMDLATLLAKLNGYEIIGRIYELNDSRKRLNDEISALRNAEHVARLFEGTGIDFGALKSEVLSFRAFEAESKEAERVASLISKSKAKAEVITGAGKKNVGFLVAYEKTASIEEAIKGAKIREIDLGGKYIDTKPEAMLKNAEKLEGEYSAQLQRIADEIDAISMKYYNELAGIKEMLEIEAARAGISGMFKKTESTFVVEGWVPKRNIESLEEVVGKAANGRYCIEAVKTDELAPTLLSRPGFLKPFDYMMEFYSVPRSDEIDPTWVFIIFFPIFYGLMVSDVGYGLASLLFVTWIAKITNPEGLVHNAAKIWQLTSISAIVFGFLSNQYFGFQLNQYFTTFTGFSWLKDATAIIGISILFGIFQVCLGLFFGFLNDYHHDKKKLAVSKLTGIVTIAFGTVAVASGFFGLLSAALALPTAIIAVIALGVTGALSGIEASELTNLITHPLSYARLMGFGLGSVIIAMLIDMAFTPTLAHGILVFIALLIVFIMLHFLNMILAIFEGIVQGIRLNFVEFFSKFYIGGGIKFRPFSYKRFYTKDE